MKRPGLTGPASRSIPSDTRGYYFLRTSTNELGQTTEYFYDPNSNLERIRYPDLLGPPVQVVEETLGWNSVGQQVWAEDPEGRRVEYEYWDADPAVSGGNAGNLRKIKRFPDGPSGSAIEQTSLVLDSLGRLVQRTEPWGAFSSQSWTARGQLETSTSASGAVTRYEYDVNGRLSRVLTPNQRIDGTPIAGNPELETLYFYNVAGLVTEKRVEVEDGVFLSWKCGYSGEGDLIRTENPDGVIGEVDLDERRLPWRVRSAVGTPKEATTEIDYDGAERPVRVVDPLGNETETVYDGYGRPFKTIDALGNYSHRVLNDIGQVEEKTFWDGKGTATEADDVLMQKELTGFDELNRVKTLSALQRIDAGVEIFSNYSWTWDRSGVLSRMTDPDGQIVTFGSDGLGRQVEIIDQLQNRVHSEFVDGQLIRTDGFNYVNGSEVLRTRQELAYDIEGRVVTTKNIDVVNGTLADQVWTKEYDVLGKLLRSVSNTGVEREFSYDGVGRLLSTHGPHQGTMTQLESKAYVGGRLNQTTDVLGNTKSYDYDDAGRLERIDHPGATSEHMTYDLAGRMDSFTDRNGSVHALNYDALGRLLSRGITTAAGVFGANLISYEYDALSRPTKGTSNVGAGYVVDRTWEPGLGLTSETFDGLTVTNVHDAKGRRTLRTSPSGRAVEYSYDLLSRLRVIRDPVAQEDLYTVDYEGIMDLVSASYGNGVTLGIDQDAFFRVTELAYEDPQQQLFEGRRFGFSSTGNLEWIEHLPEGTFDIVGLADNEEVVSVTRGADAPSSPTSADGQVTMTLDALGNRKTKSWTPWGGSAQAEAYVVGDANRYDSIDGQALSYDANGNMTDDGVYIYAYDYANRLVELTRKSDAQLIARYDYGPFGRRLKKQLHWPVQESFSFVYDAEELLEVRDSAGTFVGHYVQAMAKTDRPVVLDTAGGRYYLHCDHLGSVLATTDSQGAIVERYEYSIFGAVSIEDAGGQPLTASSVGNLMTYTGQIWDNESGLLHYRARAYAPRARTLPPGRPFAFWAQLLSVCGRQSLRVLRSYRLVAR